MKKLAKVRPEDFDVEMLLAAAREGRLFLEEKSESAEETLARCRQEALAYVKPIEAFASDEWAPYIYKVWEAIVCEDAFATNLVIKKGRMRGQLNRYFITAIVVIMRESGLYQREVPAVKLHVLMEKTEVKNIVYTSSSHYFPIFSQRKLLFRLIFDQKSKVENK